MGLFPMNVGGGGAGIPVGYCLNCFVHSASEYKIECVAIPTSSSPITFYANSTVIANVTGKSTLNFTNNWGAPNSGRPIVYGTNDFQTFTDITKLDGSTVNVSNYKYVFILTQNQSYSFNIWFT